MNGYAALCVLLLIGYNFTVGLLEAVELRDAPDAKYECGPGIWYCILIWCITHFASIPINFMAFADFMEPLTIKAEARFMINSLQERINLVFVGLGIWTCICLFTTKLECTDLFKNEYTKLWRLLILEVSMFFVVVTASIIYFVMFHIIGCKVTIKSTDESETTVRTGRASV
jgi:hypothetical protein